MNTAPRKFVIDYDGTSYQVERSMSDENIYKLNSPHGTYLISRDFYGYWIELTRRSGSADLPITLIGEQIEDHCSKVDSI
ncbi:hypothetical protein ACPPVU_00840 [Mucilaginibacter sp. McL0603]|uniref:hypothetical protein n=1 Tax=Mucilaginibacter sp. McL0603 TaxID=3415670 RepID=UPI003CEBFA5D